MLNETSGGHNDKASSGHAAAGYYQFEPGTWASASGQGGSAADYDFQTQTNAAVKNATAYYTKFGSWYDAAEAWLGGPGSVGTNNADGNGTTVTKYAATAVANMGKLSSGQTIGNLNPTATSGSTATATATATADSSDSSGAGCAIKFPGIPIPILGTEGSFCIISNGEVRALLGGTLLAVGGLVALVGIILLVADKTALGSAVTSAVPELAIAKSVSGSNRRAEASHQTDVRRSSEKSYANSSAAAQGRKDGGASPPTRSTGSDTF